MPRIDPLQLLRCLSVLLSPEGGILSREEVPRLVNLMTKFSKKLVSKCVYILILKSTDQTLVNMFMSEGGWTLIHNWLQDAIHISNWDLVKEILSLLLVTPVDVERLKLNSIPKMVKSLSRLEEVKGVQELSAQLVHDWLIIVKGNTARAEEPPKPQPVESVIKVENEVVIKEENEVDNTDSDKVVIQSEVVSETVDSSEIKTEKASEKAAQDDTISTSKFYKLSLKDGKQVLSRTPVVEDAPTETIESVQPTEIVIEAKEEENKDNKSVKNEEEKTKLSEKTTKSKSHHSSSSKQSSSSSRSKTSGSSSSSTSSSKDRHKLSTTKSNGDSSSSKDKHRDKDKREKDKYREKHKANGAKHSSISSNSSSSSSTSSKDKPDSKEKQAEKDKDTLAKIKPQSIVKLGRIPKKTDDKNKDDIKEVKKPTMSIEVRKTNEERPKTVKVFNSKRRSTGLEEEVKPPPPRPVKKTLPPALPPVIPPKRPSPLRDLPTPPEKKLKVDMNVEKPVSERPGAIKLIPPKPKPAGLQESDLFMDALTASASTKKDPKKRKRRLSSSKDTPESPTTQGEAPQIPSSPTTSPPLGLKNIAAPNFYQDTLETTEERTADNEEEEREEESKDETNENTSMEIEGKASVNTEGLKSALIYIKKKGPKKSVKFNDSDLTQVRFFELDETERVNVTKPFMDMAKMEMTSEREALLLSRKLPNEDVMEVQSVWRFPYLIDLPEPLAAPGSKSLEKDIQFAREKSVLQALYFDKRKIPDSPEEPIPENHQMSDPIIIPLEDSESQEMDLRNTPWPDPKGSPPPPAIPENQIPPQMFPSMPMPFQNFPPNAPPPGFQGIPPRFGMMNGPPQGGPPPGMYGGPPNMMPPNPNMMGPPNMGPPPHQDMMIPQGGPPLNPNAFGPVPGPDGFNPMINDPSFHQMPFNPLNPMEMYPPNNFNMNRGGGGNRGGFRRGGGGNNNGPWIRMNRPGPGNWNNRGPPGGNRGGRLCLNIKNHGYCRNMDKCPFVHPK